MATDVKAKDTPKKKVARSNERAIMDAPEKFTGTLPVKKNGGRKSLLAPIVEKLKADPGEWYIVARGKTGTVGQSRNRLMKLDANIEAETHRDENVEGQSELYARYVATAAE